MRRLNGLEWNQRGLLLLIGALIALGPCAPVRASSAEICFSDSDASDVVVRLEKCRDLESSLERCADAVDASEESAKYCESLKEKLTERIEVLTKERDDAVKMAADAAAAGKKAGSIPWYERAWTAGKWALAGGAAVAIGMAVAGK